MNVAKHGEPFWGQIVSRMRRDNKVTCSVNSDKLILKFGYGLFRKHGPARFKDIVSCMRVLGRMLNVLNLDQTECLTLMDVIDGKYFVNVAKHGEPFWGQIVSRLRRDDEVTRSVNSDKLPYFSVYSAHPCITRTRI